MRLTIPKGTNLDAYIKIEACNYKMYQNWGLHQDWGLQLPNVPKLRFTSKLTITITECLKIEAYNEIEAEVSKCAKIETNLKLKLTITKCTNIEAYMN